MDAPLFNQIVDLLIPHLQDSEECRALVEQALYGSPVLGQIRWDGAARTFTVALVRRLIDFGALEPGRPALVALLEQIRTLVGVDQQTQIDALIAQIQTTPAARAENPLPEPVEVVDTSQTVFISYQRDSEAAASELNQYLQATGFTVWQGIDNIRHTDRWPIAIRQALNTCDRLLLLITPQTMTSYNARFDAKITS